MLSKQTLNNVKLLALALLILLSLIACGPSSSALLVKAPPLDPRDEAECYDPGVGAEAISTLGETRVALADCRKKHQNVVEQYNEVRADLGGKGPR